MVSVLGGNGYIHALRTIPAHGHRRDECGCVVLDLSRGLREEGCHGDICTA